MTSLYRRQIRLTKRAKQSQAAPILRYERHSTAQSAKPLYTLLIVLAVCFSALYVEVKYFDGQTIECRRN